MKIIYYIANPPAYRNYKVNKMTDNYKITSYDSWVGFFDFPAIRQVNGILALTNEFEFEIWQPDLRADKLYFHKYDNGLIHKLYPANKVKLFGKEIIVSYDVIAKLKELNEKEEFIFQTGVNTDLFWLFKEFSDLKIIGSIRGKINIPYLNLFKIRRNILLYLNHVFDIIIYKKILNKLSYITYHNDKNLNHLKKIYSGPLQKVTSGINFNKFRKLDKIQCRKELDLPFKKKIILSVGRLNPLKQNDKLIEVLNKLKDRYDFLYIIVGDAVDNNYYEYLKQLGANLTSKNMLKFVGYQVGENLLKYYNASDVYIMTSLSEGCSGSSMEAIACGLPIISTNTGFVAELLEKNKVGKVVKIKNYSHWFKAIEEYINGNKIRTLNRNLAQKIFSIETVSYKFIKVYKDIIELKHS